MKKKKIFSHYVLCCSWNSPEWKAKHKNIVECSMQAIETLEMDWSLDLDACGHNASSEIAINENDGGNYSIKLSDTNLNRLITNIIGFKYYQTTYMQRPNSISTLKKFAEMNKLEDRSFKDVLNEYLTTEDLVNSYS